MANIIENFKSLPGPTKRLLTGGVVLGLFVALPLFLYAVTNGNFDIRNKAASGEPVTGEPIPTPTIPPLATPVATILPTPTPITCIRKLQTVTISPNSQAGTPGQTLSYTVDIVDNDSSVCGQATFSFTPLLPFPNWTAVVPPPVISSPGSHGQTIVTFTSAVNTPQGNLPVGITVTGPSGSVSATANYTLGLAPTPTPTPPAYGAMIQNGSFEMNMNADRIPDLWTWGKTLSPDKNEGIACDSNHLDGNCSLSLNGGIFQKVVSQTIRYPIKGKSVFVFDGWSKALGVRGPGQYRIELDFTNQAGKVVAKQIYNFKTGTHDFQRIGKNADTIKINKDFDTITVKAIFTKIIGKVWFDNLSLTPLTPSTYDLLPPPTPTPGPVLQFVQDLF